MRRRTEGMVVSIIWVLFYWSAQTSHTTVCYVVGCSHSIHCSRRFYVYVTLTVYLYCVLVCCLRLILIFLNYFFHFLLYMDAPDIHYWTDMDGWMDGWMDGNLLLFPAVKEFWKSVKSWESYHHEFGVLFWGPQCILEIEGVLGTLHW